MQSIIVGSGLAGLSAATELADAGHTVTLLEANTFPGGRTSSWNEDGMEIESGFHRFLGFYVALPGLLERVGVDVNEMLFWEDEIEIRTLNGTSATLGLAPLHKPLKTAWDAFGHNDFWPPSDKFAVAKMLAAGTKMYLQEPEKLDTITVAEYAKEHGVSDLAINNLLTPLTEGIFFVPVDKYSMHNLMGLFIPYAKTAHKLRVGAYMGGMGEMMVEPILRYIKGKGGSLHTDTKVDRLLVEDGVVVGVSAAGKEYRADHVVLAAPLHDAREILQATFGDHEAFDSMTKLPSMPAVTFQIELSEPCMDMDRTTFAPGTCLASFAEQSRTTFRESQGRLSIIMANPEQYLRVDPEQILKDVIRDALKVGIELEGKVVDYRKVTIPDDFYSLTPGNEKLRPRQETPFKGLVLAGDYTKQKYLATMEGAVVSGQIAAGIILGEDLTKD